jgi:hypothetical protein
MDKITACPVNTVFRTAASAQFGLISELIDQCLLPQGQLVHCKHDDTESSLIGEGNGISATNRLGIGKAIVCRNQ